MNTHWLNWGALVWAGLSLVWMVVHLALYIVKAIKNGYHCEPIVGLPTDHSPAAQTGDNGQTESKS